MASALFQRVTAHSAVHSFRFIPVLTSLLALTGCDHSPTSPTESVSGTYTLVSARGQNLPAVVAGSPGTDFLQEVTGGFVELRSDETFTTRTDYRITNNGVVHSSSGSDNGRYSVTNSSIVFTFAPGPEQLSGSISNGRLTIRADVEMVYQKSAGPPPPPSNTAPSLTRLSASDQGTLIALVTPITLEVNATDPDGDLMTATWNLGDSTTASAPFSSGRAATTKTFNAGTFQPTVTVSDGRGGTQSGTYPSIRVVALSGRWTGTRPSRNFPPVSVSLTMTQDGASITGNGEDQWTEGSIVHHEPFTLTGSITAPRTVKMQVVFVPTGGQIFPLFSVSSNADELSTDNWGGPLDQPLPLKLARQ